MMESVDDKGQVVKFTVKRPGTKEYRDSQIDYNKAFKKALEEGALLREKLTEYMVEQQIWSEQKENEYVRLLEEIRKTEALLNAGGVRLTTAYKEALKLQDLRARFRDLVSERNSLDSNTAQGQADNVKFTSLLILCTLDENGNRLFSNLDDYDKKSYQPWALAAANELGNILYDLDPEYEKNLPENKFLTKYKFANEELKLVDKEGRLVDRDGRFVDKNGRFIDYKEDGTTFFVNKENEPVNEDGTPIVEFKPFLDDTDQPLE